MLPFFSRLPKGEALDIIDEMNVQLSEYAKKTSEDPLAFLRLELIFGDLVHNKKFTTVYMSHIKSIYAEQDILKIMERGLAGINF